MQIRIAFSLTRVWQHYQNKRFAIVSAYLGESSKEINEARAAALKVAVRERGYGYVEMEGHWIETSGKYKGQELLEYPLFIPDVTYDDAVYFGSGAYFPKEPRLQQGIIFADGKTIALLKSAPNGGWSTEVEFTAMQANLEAALQRWSELRNKMSAGTATPEEIAQAGDMGWSVLDHKKPKKQNDSQEAVEKKKRTEKRPKPWRFSHVTYTMIEPPDPDAVGWGASMVRAHWKDQNPYEYYVKPEHHKRRVAYRQIIGSPEVLQYLQQDARFEFLPKMRVRILAKTTDKTIATGALRLARSKGMVLGLYSMQRRKHWRFTTSYKVPAQQQWTIDPNNILESVGAYNADVKVGKLSWHPESGELLLAPLHDQHAATIHNYGTHPFDEYVRLIVLQDEQKVLARPWSPTGGLSDEDDRVASFEAQYAAKEMLEKAGMPTSWKFETDASNQRMERLTGRRGW